MDVVLRKLCSVSLVSELICGRFVLLFWEVDAHRTAGHLVLNLRYRLCITCSDVGLAELTAGCHRSPTVQQLQQPEHLWRNKANQSGLIAARSITKHVNLLLFVDTQTQRFIP